MDDGRWTMDDGRWTMDDGRWTMDEGRLQSTGYTVQGTVKGGAREAAAGYVQNQRRK